MIEVKGLNKEIRGEKILKNISLTINKGEVIALVGPNGAGKTTLISCLTGLIRPTSGSIEVLGRNPLNKKSKMAMGIMLQESTTLENIKVNELFTFFSSFYPAALSLEELLSVTGLSQQQNLYTTKLSGGQKRRLTFGLAIIGKPDLIFLDEPTTGMDVASRNIFWEKIKALTEQGKTIILTTHYLEEIEKVASRILLMKEGAIIHDGTMASIQKEMLQNKISFEGLEEVAPTRLWDLPYVSNVEIEGDKVVLYTTNSDETLIEFLAEKFKFKNLLVTPGNLEMVFNTLMEEEQV